MSRIISIANQKGGVGKTTTSINLSASLANMGKEVLIIDMDPQGNSSRGIGIDINALNKTLFDVLINACDVNKTIKSTSTKKLDVLPSNLKLANFTAVINNLSVNPYLVLRNKIKEIKKHYDYIIIDCPPSLGLLTINALSASNSILIPVQCEYFAMEAIAQMLGTVSEVKRLHNKDLEIEGFVLTMYDDRTNLSNEIAGEVRSLFKDSTFVSEIPRNISIPEATAKLIPVLEYKPNSIGSISYNSLARELLSHEK